MFILYSAFLTLEVALQIHTENREAGLSPTRGRLAHASGSLALVMRTADLTWDALMNCFIQLSQTLQLTSNRSRKLKPLKTLLSARSRGDDPQSTTTSMRGQI